MSNGNEMDEIAQRMSGVVVAMINASTQLAFAIVELRAKAIREAARQGEFRSREVRERMRAWRQADAAVWQAAMRPQWWRQAGVEDIARVWRAASTWHQVDPQAAAARAMVVERLADRGVRIDPTSASSSPDDVAWLCDALDRAAAERATAASTVRTGEQAGGRPVSTPANGADPGAGPGSGQRAPHGVDTETKAARAAQARAADAARAEEHVRAAYGGDRAGRVVGCQAWGALVHLLTQAEQDGHDVRRLLAEVPAFVDRARTPAAFAFRAIEDRLAGMVDLGTVSTGGSAAGKQRAAAERAATPGPRPAPSGTRADAEPGGGSGVEPGVEPAKAAAVAAEGFPESTKTVISQAAETVAGAGQRVPGEAAPTRQQGTSEVAAPGRADGR